MINCSRWRHLSARFLIGWLLLSPTGFVGAAIPQTAGSSRSTAFHHESGANLTNARLDEQTVQGSVLGAAGTLGAVLIAAN